MTLLFGQGNFSYCGKTVLTLLLSLLFLSSCSKSPRMAKLAAKLYDRYQEHFLDVREKQDDHIIIYFQMDIKKYPESKIHDKALQVARFAYRNISNAIGIRSIEVYMQTIGAPTKINEPDAKDYLFNIDTLGG